MKRMRFGIAVSICLVYSCSSPSQAFQTSTKNPKAGQFCAQKEAGLKISGLVCRKVGSRYRWSH